MEAGKKLTEDELISTCIFGAKRAGHEATVNVVGNVAALLQKIGMSGSGVAAGWGGVGKTAD
ncbi:MAG: hypothetical protein H6668_17395 [Ardenticatenaceae bacterium]|nr:hypothetical protein [Ardenticatenaceae bacterium]